MEFVVATAGGELPQCSESAPPLSTFYTPTATGKQRKNHRVHELSFSNIFAFSCMGGVHFS
eukprot:1020381-Amphidinium_carterae.1